MEATSVQWVDTGVGVTGAEVQLHLLSLSLFSWEVVNSKPDERPRLSHCIAESWMNFGLFLQEMSLFKQQSPGKASFEILNVAWEQMR